MRKIEYSVHDVLDVLVAAETFGYANDILFDFLIKGKEITNKEIEDYCKTFLTKESKKDGYTYEDYKNAKEKLTELINKYK